MFDVPVKEIISLPFEGLSLISAESSTSAASRLSSLIEYLVLSYISSALNPHISRFPPSSRDVSIPSEEVVQSSLNTLTSSAA